jgi:DNA helicase-2/ATP-dependent DNA helicase PcrA
LENTIEEVEKELVAANDSLSQGEIEHRQYASLAHELYGVAKQIKAGIDNGTPPEEIAVISKQRKYLEQLLPYLYKLGVPVRYDRQQDVLQEPHIHQLVQMARFTLSVARNRPEADELLPEILSYPFWGLSRTSVWQLSRQAYESHRSWLDVMMAGNDEPLRQIGRFLIDLADKTKYEPIDRVLEIMMGAGEALVADDDSDDAEREESPEGGFVSPFKDYYFSRHKFDTERSEYLRFLSALKTFVQTLHEHNQDKVMTAEDMVALVDIHAANEMTMVDTSPYITGEKSVQLLTAHGAKGLEFETVFVISCQQSTWAKDGGYSKLSPPLNVPLSALANEEDDFLRLFYVALTRAKRNLYLSSHAAKDDGKEDEALSYVADWPVIQDKAEEVPTVEALDVSWRSFHAVPVVEDEQVLLLPLVEQYKMSVTHFNNFLDVSRGGPQLFLEQNLLRFPEPQSVQAAYGSAVHEAIRHFYLLFKRDGVLPGLSTLLELFERALRDQRLGQKDFDDCQARGRDELTLYYDARSNALQPTDEVEFNFADQQVMIGDACLTGKIDRIVKLDDGLVSVHDIKTGRPKDNWTGADAKAKVTLHKYRYQLQFYKLLIEHSRRFGGKAKVKEAMLEFVEPLHGRFIELPLVEQDLQDGEIERLKSLIVVVYDHIRQLNFPDTSDYSPDLKGLQQFEQDLLDGKI